MTSLFIEGHSDGGATLYPVDLHVEASVVSVDEYEIRVSLSINLKI